MLEVALVAADQHLCAKPHVGAAALDHTMWWLRSYLASPYARPLNVHRKQQHPTAPAGESTLEEMTATRTGEGCTAICKF